MHAGCRPPSQDADPRHVRASAQSRPSVGPDDPEVVLVETFARRLGLSVVVLDERLVPLSMANIGPELAIRLRTACRAGSVCGLARIAASGEVVVAHLTAGAADGYEVVLFRLARVYVLVVAGPSNPRIPGPSLLQALYGLTPTEAAVATSLATDMVPKEIAEDFDIGVATVRTHLRAVQRKLDARTQTDLVRRLAASAATRVGEGWPGITTATPDGPGTQPIGFQCPQKWGYTAGRE